ncbi:hypothetical protein T492DRAFT_925985 [Pavlovales sp. CCMP2436]|nr:hypothetical protein T492DRAFT_925985 [Pavlovales sp. CCMP2436]
MQLSRNMGSKKSSKQTEEGETARAAEENQLTAEGATDANPLVELGLGGGGETTTTEAITAAPPIDGLAFTKDNDAADDGMRTDDDALNDGGGCDGTQLSPGTQPRADAAKKLNEAVAENMDDPEMTSPASAAAKVSNKKKKLAPSVAKPHAKRTRGNKTLAEELVALPV